MLSSYSVRQFNFEQLVSEQVLGEQLLPQFYCLAHKPPPPPPLFDFQVSIVPMV